jgi:hypothetical protein
MDRYDTSLVTTDQRRSSWPAAAFDQQRSMQIGSTANGELKSNGNDEEWELKEALQDDETIIEDILNSPSPERGSVGMPSRFPTPAPPFFPATPQRVTSPPLLPGAVPSSGGPNWIVSAPDITKAMQTLALQLHRAPTDEEIAKKLFLTVDRYHEALTLLRDLELEISLQNVGMVERSGETVVRIQGGIEGGVFVCLRSEMMRLFRNAISTLPKREMLVISLRYCESLSDTEIRLTLDIPESTLTRLSASAALHLSARLFGSYESDHYAWDDDVRPPEAKYRRQKQDTGPEAHIYMTSGQRGCLPTGQPWECAGLEVNYDHLSRTWIAISDEGQIRPVRKTQRYELRIEGCQ